tara:strand:+ start:978 stop:1388 length:411 start_codon:yes stop_codon:yes gene_type:complete
MTPEEYYYKYVVKDKTIIYEMRIKSLAWMLGCYKKGTIRRNTIINLIPLSELYGLLSWLEERERYENCATVKEVIDTIYESDLKSKTMSKKRQKEIINLLENTIRTEQEKVGGGNKELIEKLQDKLEDVREKQIKK